MPITAANNVAYKYPAIPHLKTKRKSTLNPNVVAVVIRPKIVNFTFWFIARKYSLYIWLNVLTTRRATNIQIYSSNLKIILYTGVNAIDIAAPNKKTAKQLLAASFGVKSFPRTKRISAS